jgi:hypothetical protein
MVVAFCVLLAPAVITAVLLLVVHRWWVLLLFALSLIPPVWLGWAFMSETAGEANLYWPFILAVLEIIGLWLVWYSHDSESAGEALAVAEGAAAVYHVKKGRRVLGAMTAAGAVSQWKRSAAQPPKPDRTPPTPKARPIDSSTPDVSRSASRPANAGTKPVRKQFPGHRRRLWRYLPPDRPIGSPDHNAPKPGGWFSTPTKYWKGPGYNWSHDWCFARRISHCWYTEELDQEGSLAEGYQVWAPVDRGFCPLQKWEDQEQLCPYSKPGPHVPGGLLDVTVPWSEGGQRGGVVR